MLDVLINFWISFLAGIFAPLGAVCVLPLYPGFLSYLASQEGRVLNGHDSGEPDNIVKFVWLITAGVVTSMFLVGLIFSYFLESSLTSAIGIISPIAFFILLVISLVLIFGFDIGGLIPKYNVTTEGNPAWTSLIFGLFFGVIVLPCNPASLAVLFAISTSGLSFFINLVNFVLFGVGMAAPLLVFAYISKSSSGAVIRYLSEHKKSINLIAGLIMLGISLYYLLFVFKIQGIII